MVLIQPDSLRRTAAVPIKRRAEAIFEVWELPTMYLRLCLLSGAGQGRYALKRRRCRNSASEAHCGTMWRAEIGKSFHNPSKCFHILKTYRGHAILCDDVEA